MTLLFFLGLTFPFCLIFAMVWDVAKYRIPNALNGALALAFFPTAYLANMAWTDMAIHLGIGVAVLLGGILLYAFKLFGGGDGKLMAAASLWLGSEHLLAFIFLTAIFGGILAVAVWLIRNSLLTPFFARFKNLQRLLEEKKSLPYAIAIGFAGLYLFQNIAWLNIASG